MLVDPPLLRLESEASHAYLSMLLHLLASAPATLQEAAQVEARLYALCTATLERFQATGAGAEEAGRCMGAHLGTSRPLPLPGHPPGQALQILQAAAVVLAGPGSTHVHLASQKEECGARSPLAVAMLRGLLAYPDLAFKAHLNSLFPLLTRLISCQHAPPEVQRTLSDLFALRLGPLLQGP